MKKQWYSFYKEIDKQQYVKKSMCLACGADIHTGGMMICVDCWSPSTKFAKTNNNRQSS